MNYIYKPYINKNMVQINIQALFIKSASKAPAVVFASKMVTLTPAFPWLIDVALLCKNTGYCWAGHGS